MGYQTMDVTKEYFDIPVVLFFFLRIEQPKKIIERLRAIKPKKMYLFSDGPRNEEEVSVVESVRKEIVAAIDWDCEIIKKFAPVNQGVFEQIGKGSMWVFEREPKAIFLEDDNLPELSFFRFCEEMLDKYENEEQVLWVCGTNYLGEYRSPNNRSYVFTHHILPCGWASWSKKFLKYYDPNLDLLNDKKLQKKIKKSYCNSALYRQQLSRQKGERSRFEKQQRYVSWDHQMTLSIRAGNFYGIAPVNNQIKNIGVDNLSTHGGNSFSMIMTQRLCGMGSYPLSFPLTHPSEIAIDPEFERKIGKIILNPWFARFKYYSAIFIKRLLGLDPYTRFRDMKKKK